MRPIVTATAALVLASTVLIAQEPDISRPLSVCDLLHDRLKYDGKIVAVRGELIGNEHGSLLRGEGCEGSLVSNGYRWFMGLAFSSPGSKESLHKVSFMKDEAAFRKYETIAKERGYTGEQKLWVTFIGLFETYENLDARVVKYSDGSMLAAGFGPMAVAPGQLILKSVALNDIIVEPTSKSAQSAKGK